MSFFSSVGSWFKKFFANQSWEQNASAAIALTAPALESLVAVAANPEDAAEIQKIVSEVQTDLAVVSQLLLQAKAGTNNSQTITNILESVKASLSALLSAGHIKDAETVTKITSIVQAVVGEVEAILSALPKQ